MTSEADITIKALNNERKSARKYCCIVDGCETTYKFPTNLSRHMMLKHHCKTDGRRATNSEFTLFMSKYREYEQRRRGKRSSLNRQNSVKPFKKRKGPKGSTRYKRVKQMPPDELPADLCEYAAVVLVPKLEEMDEVEAEDSTGENSHSLSLSVTEDSVDIQNNLQQTATPLDEDSEADETVSIATAYQYDSIPQMPTTDNHTTASPSDASTSCSPNWFPPPVVSCHVLLDIVREMPGKSAFEIAQQVQHNLKLSPSDTAHVRTLLSAMLLARRELALDCLTLLPDSSEPEAIVKGKVRYIHTMLHRVLNHPKQKPYEC